MGKAKYAAVVADPTVATSITVHRSVVKAAIEAGIKNMQERDANGVEPTLHKYPDLIEELRTVANSTNEIAWAAYWAVDLAKLPHPYSTIDLFNARKDACGCALMQCGVKFTNMAEFDGSLPYVPICGAFISGFDMYMRDHVGPGALATVVDD